MSATHLREVRRGSCGPLPAIAMGFRARWRRRGVAHLSLLLALCTASAIGSAGALPTPQSLRQGGVLTFCADMQNPPTASMGPDGRQAQGVGVDLMRALGAELGLQVRLRNYRPAGIFAALDTGKCDAIMASLSRTPERMRRYDFVDYFEVSSDLLLARHGQVRFPTIESMSGTRVAVLLGSRNEAWLKDLNARFAAEGRAPVRIIAMPSNMAAFKNLDLGRVHAFLSDTVIIGYYQSRSRDRFVTAGLALRRGTTLGIAVTKGRKDVVDGLQAAMERLNENGTMAGILDRWGIAAGVRPCTLRVPCD